MYHYHVFCPHNCFLNSFVSLTSRKKPLFSWRHPFLASGRACILNLREFKLLFQVCCCYLSFFDTFECRFVFCILKRQVLIWIDWKSKQHLCSENELLHGVCLLSRTRWRCGWHLCIIVTTFCLTKSLKREAVH